MVLEKDEKGYFVMCSDATRINIEFVEPLSEEEIKQKMRELPETKEYDGIHALFKIFDSNRIGTDFKDLSAKKLDISENSRKGTVG